MSFPYRRRRVCLAAALSLALAGSLGCSSAPSAPPASASPAASSAPPAPPGEGASTPGDAGASSPGERAALTPAQCKAAGGEIVGDIGNGAIYRPGYRCPRSGEAPLGTIAPEAGQPMAVEGSVCCR